MAILGPPYTKVHCTSTINNTQTQCIINTTECFVLSCIAAQKSQSISTLHCHQGVGEVGNAHHLSPSCFSCQRPSGNNQPPGHLPNSSPVITQPHIYSLSHRDVHPPQHVFTQLQFFFSKPFHKVVEDELRNTCNLLLAALVLDNMN